MRMILATLAVALILSSCKKKNNVHTWMTVNIAGDTTWTAQSVSAENAGTSAIITATNGSKRIMLMLNAYERGNFTYNIHAAGSVPRKDQSSAEYDNGPSAMPATSGNIVITSTGANTTSGTFDFSGNGPQATGSFTVLNP